MQGTSKKEEGPEPPWSAGTPGTPSSPATSAPRSTKSAGTRSGTTSRSLAQAVERSRRRTGVNLPIEFVRSEQDPPAVTPLARLLRGGQSGEVRLKLYLCLSLLATAYPYDIREPIRAGWWAAALGLPDPDDKGSRRISNALIWLDANGYITLHRRPGRPATVTLLNPRGGGGPYVGVEKAQRWVRLPLALWEREWIVELSGSALALLVVLLELQGGASKPRYLETGRHAQYALSEDTWTRAAAELRDVHKLLEVGQVVTGRNLDMRRKRNTYWLDLDALAAKREVVQDDDVETRQV